MWAHLDDPAVCGLTRTHQCITTAVTRVASTLVRGVMLEWAMKKNFVTSRSARRSVSETINFAHVMSVYIVQYTNEGSFWKADISRETLQSETKD